MPLFQVAICVIWRQRQSTFEKPPPPLNVAGKPANYLRVQYNLLPTAFYKPCTFFAVNWGGVAKLQTDDGASSVFAPVVQNGSVSAMVVQVEHDININLDGMLDLLHHKVGVSISENKESIPNAVRNRKPQSVGVVGADEDQYPPPDVTLTTPIAERAAAETETEDSGARTGKAKGRQRATPTTPEESLEGEEDEELAPGLARPVHAVFTPVLAGVHDRHFNSMVNAAAEQVNPMEEQAPVKPTKAEKAAKKAKRGGKKAASSQKKGKGDDKKGAPEKRSEPRKKDKNEQVLTFNMDFFFNGADQLVMATPLHSATASIAQICVVLRAPVFLPPQQRVALNPLVVHLRRLHDMPVLPSTFKTGGVAEPEEEEESPQPQNSPRPEDNGEKPAEAEPPTFFASLRMPDGKVYLTKDVSYAVKMDLDELIVVFCGLLEPEQLWERVQAEVVLIEFFWRHTTPLVSNRRFQQMEIDKYIHDPNLVNIIKESGNPFALQNPLPTKFAELRVDLSSLTRGVRLLSLEIPLSTQPAAASSAPGADIQRGTCPPPFTPLQLLQTGARLRLTVSIAVPLDFLPRPAPARCVYGRLMAVLSLRGLQRSDVVAVISRLNEPAPPSPTGESKKPRRPPGDVSTPGVSGFVLRDRHLHLLFAEARADTDLQQVWLSLRSLPRRDCRLCYHSGMLFGERLYQGTPMFRSLEDRQLRSVLLTTKFYTSDKNQADPKAVRGVGECFRSKWMSQVLRQNLLPSEASLLNLHELLAT